MHKMELIVATNNEGKVKEFARILEPLGFEVISLKAAGLESAPEETGTTFAQNAEIKARAAFELSHKACIADDSGLAVDFLNGAPGVYSARYAGENATDEQNNQKLLANLNGVCERGARFVCSLCMFFKNGEKLTAFGECKGIIAQSPRGTGGFGYDPLFLVGEKSYAELAGEQKDRISHRGQALQSLVKLLEMRKNEC